MTDILFPYGYGLDYNSEKQVANNLNEVAQSKAVSIDKIVFHGRTRAPWQMLLGEINNYNQPVSGNRIESANGTLSVVSVDYKLQEDARRLQWLDSSGASGQVYWQSDSPVDFTELRKLNGALSMHFKVDELPLGKVMLRMDCGWPCSGSIDLTSTLITYKPGEWVRLSVPLSCLESAGANLGKVNTPLVLASSDRFTITLSEVAVVTKPPAASLFDCKT